MFVRKKYFFILFYLTLQYCIGFAIYQNESTTGIHVFPILNPPPASLPIPCLWVVPLHQPQASSIVHQTWTGDSFHIWYYTYFNAILPNHPTLFLSVYAQQWDFWVIRQSYFQFFKESRLLSLVLQVDCLLTEPLGNGIELKYANIIPMSIFWFWHIVAGLVCIPTNSVRGFPFLHTLSSIYCL